MAWPGPETPEYTTQEITSLKTELTAIAKAISNYEPVTLLVHSGDFSDANSNTERLSSLPTQPIWISGCAILHR